MDRELFVGIMLLFTLLIAGVIMAICEIRSEKEIFNNGYCKKCGNKLIHYDNDSQSGRGYMCERCHKYIWISYPCVDKNFNIKNKEE